MNQSYLRIPLKKPVRYLQSGQFIAEIGWQHHAMTHGDDTEIILVTSGQICLTVADQHLMLGEGDVLTVFPHETIQGAMPALEPSQFIWLHLISRDQQSKVSTHGTPAEMTAILPRTFHLQQGEKVMIAAQQLLDVAHGNYYSPVAADYAESMLLVELANNYWQQQHAVNDQQNIVNQVKEWIRIQMGQDLKVVEVAAHFSINAGYLTRLFKSATGMTVKAYMNAVKLDYAKYLLLTTSLSIAEVSEQSFFADPKYFMRLFKQKMHLTPSDYRHAYTHTFLNNQQVDPGVDVRQLLERVEGQK